jgi:hypothetical protein
MSLENRMNFYREVQAEDFDLLETTVEHAERFGLKLRNLILDKDGRIVSSEFGALVDAPDDKDKEDIPKNEAKVLEMYQPVMMEGIVS